MNLPLAPQPPGTHRMLAVEAPRFPSSWWVLFAAAPAFVLGALLVWVLMAKPVEVEPPAARTDAKRGQLLVSGGAHQYTSKPSAQPPAPAPAVVVPAHPNPAIASPYDHLVEPAAAKHGVPADLVRAVIRVESNNNPRAVSHVGAQGLMQLMPATARALNVRNAFDAEQNIDGGAKYLGQLSEKFDGDLVKTVAAYNAGPAAVVRHGGKVPPYQETQAYVKKVMGLYSRAAEEAPLMQVTEDPSSFLVWPAPGAIVRKLSMRSEDRDTGVEVRVPSAGSVRAASEGRVVAVLKSKDGTRSVTVKHDDRYTTTYAQLAVVLVDVNDVVSAGDVLGNAAVLPNKPWSILRFDLRDSDVPRDVVNFRWRGVWGNR